jgi:hypothetical protein
VTTSGLGNSDWYSRLATIPIVFCSLCLGDDWIISCSRKRTCSQVHVEVISFTAD